MQLFVVTCRGEKSFQIISPDYEADIVHLLDRIYGAWTKYKTIMDDNTVQNSTSVLPLPFLSLDQDIDISTPL